MAVNASSTGRLSAASRASGPLRGRHRAATRDTVLATAIEIADRDGLAGLTMRNLAQEMGLAVGTVYAAAGGKEEILQGLADVVLGDVRVPEVADGDWSDGLVDCFRQVHRCLVRHPAVAQLAVFMPLVGPGVVAAHDAVFDIMERGGLGEDEAATLFSTLASYTLGYALYQTSRGSVTSKARGEIELSDERFEEGLAHLVRGFRAQ